MSGQPRQRPFLLARPDAWNNGAPKVVASRAEAAKELLSNCTAKDKEDPTVFALWEALSKSQIKG